MDNKLSTTPVGLLAALNSTASERKFFADKVIDAILDGNVHPHDVQISFKCLEEMIKQVTTAPAFKEASLTEAAKHGKSTFRIHNASLTVMEAGTKYDYSAAGDPVWERLKAAADYAAAVLKEREEFLKKIPASGAVITDPDTGETKHVFPPPKTSTTTVAVKLNK